MPKTEKVFRLADDSIAVITWEGYDPTELDLPTRVGKQFRVTAYGEDLVDPEFPIVTFRLRDEDGEVSYKGLVRNDPLGDNQTILSDYGAADTGAWVIEVRQDGEWVMEVG